MGIRKSAVVLAAAMIALGSAISGWAANLFPSSGNTGVGTLAPERPLDVRGDETLSGSTSGQLHIRGLTNPARRLAVGYDATSNVGWLQAAESGVSTRNIAINPLGGNVGVGTANPEQALHLFGQNVALLIEAASTSSNGIRFRKNTVDRWFLISDALSANLALRKADGGYVMAFDQAGSVGVGTSAPEERLHVQAASPSLLIDATGTGAVGLKIRKNGVQRWHIGSPNLSADLAATNASGQIVMSVDQSGNFQVSGNLAAKYQDVAEWVKAPAQLPPGVVVVIDATERNQVSPAARAFDPRVAGVVSAQPGVLLGEEQPGHVKIAHSGRVRVRVDARYGAIGIGDLLVTSPTVGHAMRSTPVEIGGVQIHRPGTILGKALEPLTEGEGEILVLLTLQ